MKKIEPKNAKYTAYYLNEINTIKKKETWKNYLRNQTPEIYEK